MTPNEFEAFFQSHHKNTQIRRHRLVVLLQGTQKDVLGLVEHLLVKTKLTKTVYRCEVQADTTDLNVDEQPPVRLNLSWTVFSGSNVQKILGSEADAVIYNGFYGIDPDAFGALSGTIVAGGVLFLLLPESVPEQVAKDYLKRYWPHSYPLNSEQLFLKRLYDVFCRHESVIKYRLNAFDVDPISTVEKALTGAAPFGSMQTTSELTKDQLKALEKINSVITGHAKRPLIITADRGRGKSYLLGYAAAACQQKQARKVLLTSSLKSSVAIAMKTAGIHAQALLDVSLSSGSSLAFKNGGSVNFVAVDDLVENSHDCDVLFVDEAASIPTFILEKLLHRYNRVVFSSTVHGYEGHGRGFSISFRKLLPLHIKQWSEVGLSEPVRWALSDPLEAVTNASLLLDYDYYGGDELLAEDTGSSVLLYDWLSKEALVAEDDLLQEVFGLLVSAHYQTSPGDLLILLDAPNTLLLIAYKRLKNASKKRVVGVCLVCAEGGFTATLDNDISSGRRRVRGHLAPQSLAFHAGFQGAAMLGCLRVMRIATTASHLRQGIASELLRHAQELCRTQGLDYVVTSFSATPEVCEFWSRNHFRLLRVGLSKDSSSGSYTILMGRAETVSANNLFTQSRIKLAYTLKYQFITHYQTMLPETIFFIFSQTTSTATASNTSFIDSDVESFCLGQRSYELCSGAIYEWLWRVDRHLLQRCDSVTIKLLVRRVLQGQSVAAVCSELGYSGEKAINSGLRMALISLRQSALCQR